MASIAAANDEPAMATRQDRLGKHFRFCAKCLNFWFSGIGVWPFKAILRISLKRANGIPRHLDLLNAGRIRSDNAQEFLSSAFSWIMGYYGERENMCDRPAPSPDTLYLSLPQRLKNLPLPPLHCQSLHLYLHLLRSRKHRPSPPQLAPNDSDDRPSCPAKSRQPTTYSKGSATACRRRHEAPGETHHETK